MRIEKKHLFISEKCSLCQNCIVLCVEIAEISIKNENADIQQIIYIGPHGESKFHDPGTFGGFGKHAQCLSHIQRISFLCYYYNIFSCNGFCIYFPAMEMVYSPSCKNTKGYVEREDSDSDDENAMCIPSGPSIGG